MSLSNSWASAAGDWLQNKEAAATFNRATTLLKDLTEPDVGRAHGHGVEVNRAKNGSLKIKETK